jgi:putative copper resistance protein D
MIVALALVRAAHYLSLMTIFGAEALRALLVARLKPVPEDRVPTDVFHWAAATAFVTAIILLALTMAQATGEAGAFFDGHMLAVTTTETSFGPFLVARIAACGFLLMATFVPGTTRARLLLSGFALADIAFTSHAAASSVFVSWARVANDAVHLLAAGFWFGALVALAPFVIAHRSEPERLVPPLKLFSRYGLLAVALLVIAGTINGILILYADPARWSPTYLTLLAIKLVLAALMVALALANRFSLLPGVSVGNVEAEQNLVGSVIAEIATGAIIVMIVGFLGVLPPLAM